MSKKSYIDMLVSGPDVDYSSFTGKPKPGIVHVDCSQDLLTAVKEGISIVNAAPKDKRSVSIIGKGLRISIDVE